MDCERTKSGAKRSKLAKTLEFKTLRTIFALSVREMSTAYGKNAGGYFWAIVEPILAIALLSFVFELVLRSPSIGSNFQIFYASGLLPYAFYNQTANKVARAVRFSKSLLFYPSVTFVDAITARFMVNAITHVIISYVLLTGIILFYDLRLSIDVPSLMLGMSMAAVLGLGIGVLNCFLFAFVPFWDVVWTVLNRPLFILSTVIYAFEDVPVAFRDWLWFNPLIHVVGAMRRGVYSTYDAHYVEPMYVFGIGLTCLCLGLLFLKLFVFEILNR